MAAGARPGKKPEVKAPGKGKAGMECPLERDTLRSSPPAIPRHSGVGAGVQAAGGSAPKLDPTREMERKLGDLVPHEDVFFQCG